MSLKEAIEAIEREIKDGHFGTFDDPWEKGRKRGLEDALKLLKQHNVGEGSSDG